MADWDWTTTPGNVGELPVKIRPGDRVELLLDADQCVRVNSFTIPVDEHVRPGDVCIFTAEIEAASTARNQTEIDISVIGIEFIRKSTRPSPRIDEMMTHLDSARRRHEERGCDNCGIVDGSTRVTVKTKAGNRDLHYCSKCGRLLSTREYEQWNEMNHR